jgi:predicted ATPase/DNA-binding SARP family transcriptional activator/DNA-binding CsgD family transcriptional regulator
LIQQRDMSDSLEIFTLGKLQIRRSGLPLADFPTRKVEALLVYLACTGRSYPREQLAELLWDDRTQEQSLTNLRATLSRLNGEVAPFLKVTRKAISIQPQTKVWVDSVELSTTLQSTKRPLTSSAAGRLEQALTLYKGDFLEGFYIGESRGFEDWQLAERERLRVGVTAALSQLIPFYLEQGCFEAGLAHASRLLELDPLREETHRHMMMLLAGSGQRSAALAHYDACRRILAEAFGVEPEAETTALYHKIRSGAFVPPAASWKTTFHIPEQPTPFIGREAELVQLEDYLDDSTCRLLTLIGPGGVGKTRLAYQVAASKAKDFASGVCAVPLAGLASPDYLLPTIAEHLSLPLSGSVDQKTQLLDYLREKRLLLVMDNCEHILDGIALLGEILAAAPGVKIVATSRERLNVQGEWLFPVYGLPFPQNESETDAETYGAMQLFVQSARRGGPGFHFDDVTDVARICQLVEGLPLAIELAASWVHQMPVARIASHIEHDLDFLSTNLRDVPERHRSTRALFEHSWRLLSKDEQAVLRKLSVFRGGFDAEAAEYIAGTSLHMLTALTEKSLVRASPSGHYDLHELLRQFAEEKVREAGEFAATRDRHLDYFVTWAEEAERRLYGGEQMKWHQRIETEHDNLRAALRWGTSGQRAETGLRLANALWWFWFRHGYWREGFGWLKVGIERTEGDTSTRATAMLCAATLLGQLQTVMAGSYLNEGLRMSEKLGLHDLVAMSYVSLSFAEADYEKATEMCEQALSLLRRVNARLRLMGALLLYGDRVRAHGDLTRAEALYQESLTIAQAVQNRELMASLLGNLGRLAVYRQDYERAAALIQQAVAIVRELGSRVSIADWLVYLGTLEVYRGNFNAAEQYLKETLALFRDLGNQIGIAHVTYCLADLALHQGDYERAARMVNDSLLIAPSFLANFFNREYSIARLLIVGKLACVCQNYEQAARLFGATEALREQSGYVLEPLPQIEYQESMTNVQKHMDITMFEAAWTQGQTLTEAEAVRFALNYLQSAYVLVDVAQATAFQNEKDLIQDQGHTMTRERTRAFNVSGAHSQEPSSKSSTPVLPSHPDGLTRREVEVLRLIAEGRTDAQVAEQLVISPRTVNHHLTSIYRKIQVSTRAAATRYAFEHRLV